MGRKYEMNWVPSRAAWRREHLAQKYLVSCRQLRQQFPGLVDDGTKTGSYKAANAWWRLKMATLYEHQIMSLRQLREAAVVLGSGLEPAFDLLISEWVKRANAGIPFPVELDDEGCPIAPQTDPPKLVGIKHDLAHGLVSLLAQNSKVLGLSPVGVSDAVQVVRTLEDGLEEFLQRKERQHDQGTLSEGRLKEIKSHVNQFKAWLGSRVLLASEELCFTDAEGYFDHLNSRRAKGEIGGSRARDLWATTRQSIRWLQSMERVKQFDLSSLTISVGTQDIETFTTDEIRVLLKNADERLRLYQLLMLNIAGTQKDVSDLHPSELDLKAKRIIRKRSKKSVQNADFVPTVSYLLWDETWELLRKHHTSDSQRVLLTANGAPLVGRGRTDYIGKDWRKYRDDLVRRGLLNRKLPLKSFRKFVASAIANEFGEELAKHFCGHSKRSTLARHYWQKDDGQLDKAVVWLGEQLGL